MKTAKNIFIAATGQNVGKTTNCLGLYDKLLKSGLDTGFIKPVGQRYLNVRDYRVDEDSYLIHQIYDVNCDLKHMNPVAVPQNRVQAKPSLARLPFRCMFVIADTCNHLP